MNEVPASSRNRRRGRRVDPQGDRTSPGVSRRLPLRPVRPRRSGPGCPAFLSAGRLYGRGARTACDQAGGACESGGVGRLVAEDPPHAGRAAPPPRFARCLRRDRLARGGTCRASSPSAKPQDAACTTCARTRPSGAARAEVAVPVGAVALIGRHPPHTGSVCRTPSATGVWVAGLMCGGLAPAVGCCPTSHSTTSATGWTGYAGGRAGSKADRHRIGHRRHRPGRRRRRPRPGRDGAFGVERGQCRTLRRPAITR